MPADDGLRDNLLLEKAMLADDSDRRIVLLADVTRQFPRSDGGIRAMYELGLLKIQLWKDTQNPQETRDKLLLECRTLLTTFSTDHPESPYAEQAQSMLQSLPYVQ
jgi:hypothetical protein